MTQEWPLLSGCGQQAGVERLVGATPPQVAVEDLQQSLAPPPTHREGSLGPSSKSGILGEALGGYIWRVSIPTSPGDRTKPQAASEPGCLPLRVPHCPAQL